MSRKKNNKEELKKIGIRMRKIRGKLRITQDDMVKNIEIGRANYSRIEKGDIMPCLELLQFLNEHYKISLEWILTGKGSMTRRKIKNVSNATISESPSLTALIIDVTRNPFIKFRVLESFYRSKAEYDQLQEELNFQFVF